MGNHGQPDQHPSTDTSLDAVDIGIISEMIELSFTWEDQEALWDTNLPSYHPETAFADQINSLKARGWLID